MPSDIKEYLGISCYKPTEHIRFAIENQLKYLELRPNILKEKEEEVLSLIALWRQQGGQNLSIHLSEVFFDGLSVAAESKYESLIELGIKLKAERYTQHVPIVSVKTVKANQIVLEKIADYITDRVNKIPYPCTIGVENMHMTATDEPNDNRRFGYTPEETLEFMFAIKEKCKHKVGINFDVGHARNNAPYSQKYQVSTWYSMLGKYIVGYHIHQVTIENEKFENHMPITDFYGKLISYASFFKCWELGKINKAPCVFEMRPENAYSITLETFTR